MVNLIQPIISSYNELSDDPPFSLSKVEFQEKLDISSPEIAQKNKLFGVSTNSNNELITILFAEIKAITAKKIRFSKDIKINELNNIFNEFDKIIKIHKIEKIKIIDNTYICAGGPPISNKTNAVSMVNVALEMLHFMKDLRIESAKLNLPQFEVRIGINTGNDFDITKNYYEIYEATTKYTSIIVNGGETNKINISENTYHLIKDEFNCEFRGKIDVKGSGKNPMYFVHGFKNKATNFDLIEKRILKMLKKGLSHTLHYHGYPHTIDVINNVKLIAKEEKITNEDIHLLKMAALFHDLGFLEAYTGHEAVGCKMAKEMLPAYGVSSDDIDEICDMIMATKVPQTPKTLLEKILCDADLLYLGTENFIETGNTLFLELIENRKLKTEREWNELQVNFLKKHHFHTNYCIKNFVNLKEKNLNIIKEWLLNN